MTSGAGMQVTESGLLDVRSRHHRWLQGPLSRGGGEPDSRHHSGGLGLVRGAAGSDRGTTDRGVRGPQVAPEGERRATVSWACVWGLHPPGESGGGLGWRKRAEVTRAVLTVFDLR